MNNKTIQKLYDNKDNISIAQKSKFINVLDNIDHLEDKRNKNNDVFHIYLADNDIMQKIFIITCLFINLCTKKTSKLKYVGIDFEFNDHRFGLMQININNIINDKIKYIWLVDLNEFNKKDKSIIVNSIFLNDYLYKILHGADSLDIPYIFEDLLDNKKDKILTFMNRFTDTRFICEYIRNDRGLAPKCSIYDALKYFDTIDENKYISLNNINESIGPTYKIKWDIYNLNYQQIKYAYYDVLFLDTFLVDMYKNIDKKNAVYYKYINEVIRFIILERKGISDIIEKAKKNVTLLNNNMVEIKGNKYTLTKLFDISNQKLIINDGEQELDIMKLISNNYVKSLFVILLKNIFYENIYGDIKSDFIYKELEDMGFNRIKKILKQYSKIIKIKISEK